MLDPTEPSRFPEPSADLALRYSCNLTELDDTLSPLFIRLSADAAAKGFMADSYRQPHGSMQRGLQRTLRLFLSDFDANGLLGTYPMHLLSTPQWRSLLGPVSGKRLLDIGAGDGGVTAPLAELFEHTTVTETSKPMAWRLRRRGYSCHAVDVSHQGVPDPPYDVVSLLNVLDRCSSPLSLLTSAVDALASGGLLVIALVLPYRPFFYSAGGTPQPLRPLPLTAEMSFEIAMNSLVRSALGPLSLTPVALSRAPYLSWGDTHKRLYALDDAIVVCRKRYVETHASSPHREI